MDASYLVVVKADPAGGYWTQVPALPGCGSQGDTIEDAVANTREAINSYLGSLMKHGEPVPEDRTLVTQVAVRA